MATTVILSSPSSIDLRALADTTWQSLSLLKPWVLRQPHPKDDLVVAKISLQAAQYVDAIGLTVAAAYSGFTVTQDVLYLADALQTGIEDKEDLNRYIVGMLALATESRGNANKALEAFREIRKEICTLQQELSSRIHSRRADMRGASDPQLLELYKKLQDDIESLSKFTHHISAFASWWDWVKIESDPVQEDLNVEFQLDALRGKATIIRWKDLRSKYTSYVQMVEEMEDAEPQLFGRKWNERRFKANQTATHKSIFEVIQASTGFKTSWDVRGSTSPEPIAVDMHEGSRGESIEPIRHSSEERRSIKFQDNPHLGGNSRRFGVTGSTSHTFLHAVKGLYTLHGGDSKGSHTEAMGELLKKLWNKDHLRQNDAGPKTTLVMHGIIKKLESVGFKRVISILNMGNWVHHH